MESIAGISVTAFVSISNGGGRCNLLSDRWEEAEGAMFFPSPPPSRLPLLNGADTDQSPQTNGRTRTNELLVLNISGVRERERDGRGKNVRRYDESDDGIIRGC